jgi:hypothetical protein
MLVMSLALMSVGLFGAHIWDLYLSKRGHDAFPPRTVAELKNGSLQASRHSAGFAPAHARLSPLKRMR